MYSGQRPQSNPNAALVVFSRLRRVRERVDLTYVGVEKPQNELEARLLPRDERHDGGGCVRIGVAATKARNEVLSLRPQILCGRGCLPRDA